MFTVDEDVEILRTIKKQDVVEFYNEYIDPASPKRSKTSIQMAAAAVSPEDRKPAIAEALVTFLSASAGVVTEPAEVTKTLDNVDINDTDAVVAAVRTFLMDVKKIESSSIDGILEKGREALNQAVPAKKVEDDKFSPEQFGNVLNEVNDVVAWKASCRISAGPRPVRPLVEFEATEVKL